MKTLLLHSLIEKHDDRYTALCLELDVATEGKTLKEVKARLKEAAGLYIEDVIESGDEKGFIPRPAPAEAWLKYFKAEAKLFSKELRVPITKQIRLKEVVYA